MMSGAGAPDAVEPGPRSSDVTLVCSADGYAPGDTVFFVWTNNTDSTAVATYHPPYEIYDARTGELIYFGPFPMEYHLPPHESADLSWDQLDWDGNPVPLGSYIVRISFVFNDSPPGHVVEDRFEITLPATVPEGEPAGPGRTWGAVKGEFRE
jgi:hypothetical protein